MPLDPAMSALASRTAAAFRADLECSNCGDAHTADDCTHVITCRHCDAEAIISSAVGLDGDFDDQRRYVRPRPEWRCEDCQASFERAARLEQRLAEEGWI